MKYLCFLSGILLILTAILAWTFYAKASGDEGGGYVFVGIAGFVIAALGIHMHIEKK